MFALCTAVTFCGLSRRAYSKAKRAIRSDPEPGDDLDRLGRVAPDHVLDAGVEVLGVLPHDDQIDALVPRPDTGDAHRRTEVRVEVELLAQGDVHAAEARADRRGHRALDGHLGLADGLDHLRGQRRAVLVHHVGAGLDVHPVDVDPVAATATFVAAMISGPMPSPGMHVTSICAHLHPS